MQDVLFKLRQGSLIFIQFGAGWGKKRQKGQGILIAMALFLVSALVVMAIGSSGMGNMHTQANYQNRQSLQLYYVAQAGLQEALATRMVPRSNYLALNSVSGVPPIYPLSGSVYQNPESFSNRIGYYRYMVLGGDPAMSTAGVFQASQFQKNLPVQPFYLVSEGSVCRSPNGVVTPNKISLNTSLEGRPSCATGFTLDQVVLVSALDLSRTSNPNKDLISNYRVFKNPGAVTVDTAVFVPNYGGVQTTFDFNTAWSRGATGNNSNKSILPTRLLIATPLSTTANVTNIGSTGSTTGPSNINPKSILWLYFQGAFDPRTVNNTGCTASASACNIRIKKSTGEYYGGSLIQPNWPGGTQAVMFPPLVNGGAYTVEILPGIGDDKGNRLATTNLTTPLYSISFTVAP